MFRHISLALLACSIAGSHADDIAPAIAPTTSFAYERFPDSEKQAFLAGYNAALARGEARLAANRQAAEPIIAKKCLDGDIISKRLVIVDGLLRHIRERAASNAPDAWLQTRQALRELALFNDYFADAISEHHRQEALKTRTVSVKDYGALGDGSHDDGPAIRKAIADNHPATGERVVIHFPKGNYVLAGREDGWNGLETYSNNPFTLGGPQLIRAASGSHLNLHNLQDLTLQGEDGSTLTFNHLTTTGILLYGCRSVAINNLTLRRPLNGVSEGHIVAVAEDRKSIDVQTDPITPDPDHDIFKKDRWVNYLFEESERRFVPASGVHRLANVEKLSEHLYRFHNRGSYPASWRPGLRTALFARGGAATMQAIHSAFCHFDGLKFRESSCNSFSISTCHATAITNCVVAPISDQHRVSTPADAVFVGNNSIAPYVANCHFERMGDDGYNTLYHSPTLAKVTGATFTVRKSSNDFFPGATAQFFSPSTGQILAERQVLSTTREKDPTLGYLVHVTVDQPLPDWLQCELNPRSYMTLVRTGEDPKNARYGDLVINRNTCGMGAVVVNNRYVGNRNLGINIQAPNALVQGCTFEDISSAALCFGAMIIWVELPGPHNLTVRDCSFKRCPTGIFSRYTLHDSSIATSSPFANILIEGNSFEDCPKTISLRNTDHAVVRNNTLSGTSTSISIPPTDNNNPVLENNRSDDDQRAAPPQ
ncbi:MAG: glycosyl hydrolase family 28-related protein [Lentisphaeria bacterium]|nr:glycosyl hydrolase family 28-related protein [Lentisphaeria bacterium]